MDYSGDKRKGCPLYKSRSKFLKKSGFKSGPSPSTKKRDNSWSRQSAIVPVCLECQTFLTSDVAICPKCGKEVFHRHGEEYFGAPKFQLVHMIRKKLQQMNDDELSDLFIEIDPAGSWSLASLRNRHPVSITVRVSKLESGQSKEISFPGDHLLRQGKGISKIIDALFS